MIYREFADIIDNAEIEYTRSVGESIKLERWGVHIIRGGVLWHLYYEHGNLFKYYIYPILKRTINKGIGE